MKSGPRRSLTGGMIDAAAANGIVVCKPGPRPVRGQRGNRMIKTKKISAGVGPQRGNFLSRWLTGRATLQL